MQLVRFENTTFNYPMAINPGLIEQVIMYNDKPEVTGVKLVNVVMVINVNYSYETTCDMIDAALRAPIT